jgi:hypothetical protein
VPEARVSRPLRRAAPSVAGYPKLRAAWRILIASTLPAVASADATLPPGGGAKPPSENRERKEPEARPEPPEPPEPPKPPPRPTRREPDIQGLMGRRVRIPSFRAS